MSIHLVSDDLIDSGATLYATEHDYASIEQAYERGAKSLRDIYEAELQSMRDRLSRMEEAGNAMARMFVKFEEEKRELGWMPTANDWDSMRNLASMWNAALSNK